MFSSGPRALRDATVLKIRHEMSHEVESAVPLTKWADNLAERLDVTVPLFDPAEAGTRTQVLVLLEAPGPMTSQSGKRPGSGFISVDNDDVTAENSWVLRNEAALSESVALQWNIVPWYLGPASVKPNVSEVAQGALALRELLELLPELRVVVNCGLFAQRGWSRFVAPFREDVTVIDSWHPSPLSMNQAGKRDALRRAFVEAASLSR